MKDFYFHATVTGREKPIAGGGTELEGVLTQKHKNKIVEVLNIKTHRHENGTLETTIELDPQVRDVEGIWVVRDPSRDRIVVISKG